MIYSLYRKLQVNCILIPVVRVPYLQQTVQIITMETKHFVVVTERLVVPAL